MTTRNQVNPELMLKLTSIMDKPDALIDKGKLTISGDNGRMDIHYQISEWIKYDSTNKSGIKIRIIYSPHCNNHAIRFHSFEVMKFRTYFNLFTLNSDKLKLTEDSAAMWDISKTLHVYTLRADRIMTENDSEANKRAYNDKLRETENKLSKIL